MAGESPIITFRLKKGMHADMHRYMKRRGYSSKTEFLREAVREKLYQNLQEMRGALKGKVKLKGTHAQWRRAQWQKALKKAKGDIWTAPLKVDR